MSFPKKNAYMQLARSAALFSGCSTSLMHQAGATVVLHPAGAVAAQQGHLIVVSTLLMLLVIIPVMVLTVVFAWRYRKSNTRRYLCAGLGSLDPTGAGDLGGAAADHHRSWRGDLDQHPYARSLSPAATAWMRASGGHDCEAVDRRGRGTRLEVAVHLSGAGHRGRERPRGPCGCADHTSRSRPPP